MTQQQETQIVRLPDDLGVMVRQLREPQAIPNSRDLWALVSRVGLRLRHLSRFFRLAYSTIEEARQKARQPAQQFRQTKKEILRQAERLPTQDDVCTGGAK